MKGDDWLTLSCLQGFHYWPELCRVVERLDLVDDERFNTVEALMVNADEGAAILQEEFLTATLAEWRERFDGFKGQWAPMLNSLELADDEQVIANGYLQDTESKDGTKFRLVATPVQFDGQPSTPTRAPDFNEHGEQILVDELGLDWDAVIDLKLKNIVA